MPWDCLSFMRTNLTTLDFVVKNYEDMMILQSVAVAKLYDPDEHIKTMHQLRRLSIKMKVGYSSWLRKKPFI